MNILITGGASNIAYQVANKISKNHRIYLTTHTNKQSNKIKHKVNDNIECFKLDINKDLHLIDNLDIDCLISFAAIGIGGSILGMDTKYLKDNFNTNFFSQIELIKRVYKQMEKKNKGKIFITSSLAGFLPLPMLGNYCSSKSALSTIITSIYYELKLIKSNITITLIEPGAYYTGFNQVMIDNKDNYLNKESIFYKQKDKFTNLQNKIFNLIEKKNTKGIVNAIVRQVNKPKPRFHIRKPIIQVIFIKIYIFFFR